MHDSFVCLSIKSSSYPEASKLHMSTVHNDNSKSSSSGYFYISAKARCSTELLNIGGIFSAGILTVFSRELMEKGPKSGCDSYTETTHHLPTTAFAFSGIHIGFVSKQVILFLNLRS